MTFKSSISPSFIAQDENNLYHVFSTSDLVLEKKIIASDGVEGDRFGNQVDFDENILVVSTGSQNTSAVYIFEQVNGVWTQTAKLTPSDSQSKGFGDTLRLNGTVALIGHWANEENGFNAGAVYIFEPVNGAWTQTAKLTASDGQSEDRFGMSSAQNLKDGDTILVGAPGDDDRGTDAGAVYIFQKIEGTWTETAKLWAEDGQSDDQFGRYIDVDGSTAIIGAFYGDGEQRDSGAAYILEEVNGIWQQTAKLTASDGMSQDLFGRAVKIDGNTAIVGAYQNEQARGAAYIFEKVNGVWTQTAKLTASDGAEGDNFGRSVAIEGEVAVVSSSYDDDNGTNSGAVYLYEKVNGVWQEIYKILPPDGAAGDYFGNRVDLDGNTITIGARGDDNNVPNSGSVYVYQIDRAGNTLGDARYIGILDATPLPQTFSDRVGNADIRDFYRFQLQAPSQVTLTLDQLSANANIYLGDSKGRQLASSINRGTSPEILSYSLNPGTYYVLVLSADRLDTNYDLTLSTESVNNLNEATVAEDAMVGSCQDNLTGGGLAKDSLALNSGAEGIDCENLGSAVEFAETFLLEPPQFTIGLATAPQNHSSIDNFYNGCSLFDADGMGMMFNQARITALSPSLEMANGD